MSDEEDIFRAVTPDLYGSRVRDDNEVLESTPVIRSQQPQPRTRSTASHRNIQRILEADTESDTESDTDTPAIAVIDTNTIAENRAGAAINTDATADNIAIVTDSDSVNIIDTEARVGTSTEENDRPFSTFLTIEGARTRSRNSIRSFHLGSNTSSLVDLPNGEAVPDVITVDESVALESINDLPIPTFSGVPNTREMAQSTSVIVHHTSENAQSTSAGIFNTSASLRSTSENAQSTSARISATSDSLSASDDATSMSAGVITTSATEVSPYFLNPNHPLPGNRNLNGSSVDFQTDDEQLTAVTDTAAATKKEKKKGKGKKRKATDSCEEDADEGSCCTICFEPWSNSGDHRIASLRCGHFFGFICIEKWLKGTGASCPNCNEKSTKKDIRVHYVSKLKALDTSEKDRALADLDKEKTNSREIQLRLTEYQVRNRLLQEEIEKLQRELHQYRKFRGDLPPALQNSQPSSIPSTPTRLVYQKRYEMVRPGTEKTCRVLAYSEYLGMLVISQPSFTALAPGFGVRQFNVLDQKVGNFISLCKEQIRDMSFSSISQHLLLSCGQDRTARVTNMSNGHKVTEFQCDHQVWACDWSAANDYHVYLGTQKGSILVYDMRQPTAPPVVLVFPDGDKKPIIGLRSVPEAARAGFPNSGFLVANLSSLWFVSKDSDETWSFHKLNMEQKLIWSLDFDRESFLVLVGCKPCPLAAHLVLELSSTQIESGRTYIVRTLMVGKGGSFSQRSFLRSSLLPSPTGQVYTAFSKGSGQTDHRVVIQEVGSDRVLQELKVDKPVIDIKHLGINSDRYLALLGETDLIMYKWNPMN